MFLYDIIHITCTILWILVFLKINICHMKSDLFKINVSFQIYNQQQQYQIIYDALVPVPIIGNCYVMSIEFNMQIQNKLL